MTGTKAPGVCLLTGTLAEGGPWPLNLRAILCDLRPRFLAKACAGPGFRWVSRNGRVLLCGDRPLDELAGRASRVRLQTWNRAVLAGEPPEPYGLLFCVRAISSPRAEADHSSDATYATRLVATPDPVARLNLDVGGGLALEFRTAPIAAPGNGW
jgi:hypothetical protein